MIVFALRSLALDEHGIVVSATVKKVLRNYFNIVVNNVYVYRRLLLEIPGAHGGPTYEDKLWMLCETATSPAVGDRLKLRVDPRHPRHYAVDRSHFASD